MRIGNSVSRFCVAGLLAMVVAGCATKEQIPPERLKDYALLVPRQNNNSIISEIDGRSPGLSLSGATVNMQPGRHTVETTSCFGGTNTCKPDAYTFEAQPGIAYVFRNPSVVEVYDRFNMDKPRIGYLHDAGSRVFVNDREYAALQDKSMRQVIDAGLAVSEQRKRNLPLVRKIGARICQERNQGIIYIGYVEAIAEEKVQIRVADAQLKGNPAMRPGGFSPTIIWESPMQWDLCE
jgi:hypothetical protein